MPGNRKPEEHRREEILEGAFRVALREKLWGLTMSAVAKEAGVSKGLIFFHFEDKETLLLSLLGLGAGAGAACGCSRLAGGG